MYEPFSKASVVSADDDELEASVTNLFRRMDKDKSDKLGRKESEQVTAAFLFVMTEKLPEALKSLLDSYWRVVEKKNGVCVAFGAAR